MKRIGYGILGTGFMARTYAECLARHVESADLVAAALGSGGSALADEFGVPIEPTAEALLARDDIDAVIVATPHSTHVQLATQVAAAGKHVYLEKPMAVDVAGCDAILDAWRAARVKLTVNKVTRFRESPMAARALLRSGAIGHLRMVRITSSVVDYTPTRGRWASYQGEGGGWLDMGVHLFDGLRWFTGAEATRVFASVRDYGGVEYLRRSGMAEVLFDDGVSAQLLVSMEMAPPGIGSQSQWLFIGSDGFIESDSYGKVRLGRDGGWEDIHEMASFALNQDYRDPVRLRAFAAQAEDFARAIIEDRAPAVSGADGRAAVELVEAAQHSSDLGASVELPLQSATRAR